MRRRHGQVPHHPLAQMKDLVAFGHYVITRSARRGAEALYLGEPDICACVRALSDADYEKTLASYTMPGTFQDVYRTRYLGYAVYLKLQLGEPAATVVISFKQDESA